MSAENLRLAAHYRRQAAGFRALAKEVSDEGIKAELLAVSRMYEEFAEQAETPET
jgi:hypothetical protein